MRVFRKKSVIIPILACWLIIFPTIAQHPYNLKDHKICYIVAYAHLDTQWQWTLGTTISQYIPNTLNQNFSHFSAYPEYIFSFEGSYRYLLAKQFHLSSYNTLKTHIANNRWACMGAFVDGCDVNIPSPESLIRHVLYGNMYFKDEFGKTSIDILLPDCFGFPYTLPTIANHCGLFGFSTQKFDLWGGWTQTPFPIGIWEGVDGSQIIACLKPGSYGDQAYNIRTTDGDWLKTNSQNNGSPGVWATLDYMGTGDVGGAPSSSGVASMCTRIRQNNSEDIKVINTSSDQIFHDFLKYPQLIDGLPKYKGELVMKTHGVGCYTSWARLKTMNRQNEQRAEAAELASVMAFYLNNTTYPTAKLAFAWTRFLDHQMHDDLTGTSIPTAYSQYTIPAVDSSLNEFKQVLDASNTAVANLLDTRVSQTDRVAVAVYNPLGVARKDIVEATIDWGSTAPDKIQVFGPDGNEVPSQVTGRLGNNLGLAFFADMPAMGYKVFEVSPTTSTLQTDLKISTTSIENDNYTITVDANGDISAILDKKTNKQLLTAPSRFEMRTDQGTGFPAWEITYANVTATPREYVSGSVQKTIQESGPARVSLKITRTQASSSFTHYIRLGTKEAGSFIDIANTVDWRTDGTLLKVSFPLSCSNANATFDLGIGAIDRPNYTQNRYEVSGQQWADLSNTDNTYGVSILNDCKYGWDKASNSLLHLTLIHSPSGGSYNYQRDLSNLINWVHSFKYGIYGHANKWSQSSVVQEAERFNQPLIGFKAAAHAGIGKEYSFMTNANPEQMVVMALKKAEKSDKYIVRVRETRGETLASTKLSFPSNVKSVANVNGQELVINATDTLPRVKPAAVTSSGKDINFSLKPFEVRAFAFELDPPVTNIWNSHNNANLKPCVPFYVNVLQKKLNFYLLPNESVKKVVITDMAGKIIHVLNNDAAKGNCRWDAKSSNGASVSSGVYIVNVITDKRQTSEKLSLLR